MECGDFVYFATPQMLTVLNEARFIEADVTFPRTKEFPYLLNMSSFNFETLRYQVVARVLMTHLTVAAYKEAFAKVLELTTNIHPEFEFGKGVRGWLLDFSEPQRDGLAANLGDQGTKVIIGCLVHYKRGVKKVADKVCNNDCRTKNLFKKIAYAIPLLDNQEDVDLAFEILCGKVELHEETVEEFLLSVIKVTQEETADINTAGWLGAIRWAKWWSRVKITKMFTKSFTEMTEDEWNYAPKTTNSVESQNRQTKKFGGDFNSLLAGIYRTDRKFIYETHAARDGIITGVSLERRHEINLKRRRKTAMRFVGQSDENQFEAETFAATEIKGNNNTPEKRRTNTTAVPEPNDCNPPKKRKTMATTTNTQEKRLTRTAKEKNKTATDKDTNLKKRQTRKTPLSLSEEPVKTGTTSNKDGTSKGIKNTRQYGNQGKKLRHTKQNIIT